MSRIAIASLSLFPTILVRRSQLAGHLNADTDLHGDFNPGLSRLSLSTAFAGVAAK